MKTEDLVPVTENSLREFRTLKKGNALLSVYLERWVDYKKKNFSNYVSYAYDKEGNLYRRDVLQSKEWVKTDKVVEEQKC